MSSSGSSQRAGASGETAMVKGLCPPRKGVKTGRSICVCIEAVPIFAACCSAAKRRASPDSGGQTCPPGKSAIRVQRFQFVDQAFDHRKAAIPEGRVGCVEAEGLQKFGMMLGAAGLQKLEILLLEAG